MTGRRCSSRLWRRRMWIGRLPCKRPRRNPFRLRSNCFRIQSALPGTLPRLTCKRQNRNTVRMNRSIRSRTMSALLRTRPAALAGKPLPRIFQSQNHSKCFRIQTAHLSTRLQVACRHCRCRIP